MRGEGGAIFAFSAKSGLKSVKNVAFCILCMPNGEEAVAPLCPSPWLRYCLAMPK